MSNFIIVALISTIDPFLKVYRIFADRSCALVIRTSFAYLLTVINNGDKHHRLYIKGLEVQTDLLRPGKQEAPTVYSGKKGVYKYFDKQENLEHLGFLEIKTVVARDEFTGIWHDLI